MINKEGYLELADALDSGQYQQGFGQLERNGKMCVAGVACHLFQSRLNLRRQKTRGGYIAYGDPGSTYTDDLGATMGVKWYLDGPDLIGTILARAMVFNDFNKMPFPEIAKFIRDSVE